MLSSHADTDKTRTIGVRKQKGADRLRTANPFVIDYLGWLRGPATTDSDGYQFRDGIGVVYKQFVLSQGSDTGSNPVGTTKAFDRQ